MTITYNIFSSPCHQPEVKATVSGGLAAAAKAIARAAAKGIIIVAVAATTACTSADMLATEPDGAGGGPILFGTPRQVSGLTWSNGMGGSRADMDVASEIPLDLGVFAFGDGPNTTYIFRNQQVYNVANPEYRQSPFNWEWSNTAAEQWPYTTDRSAGSVQRPWEKMRYRFFAYSPWYETENVRVSAENHAGFNTFTWDNIPGFTDKDFVLCNEIAEVDNRAGNFTSTGNIIHFSMRHILSRIRFFFKMTPAYHQIRRIELNSVTIITAGRVKTATFNFKNNAWDETVHWSNEQTGEVNPVELFNKESDHYFLPSEYPEAPYTSVYVYPQDDFEGVTMRMKYIVYDSDGLPTREATLVNTVTTPKWKLISGYYYDIKVLVAPDYLYVLSDNDQTFDGYVIIDDDL